ncbi:MAG: RNA-binding protein [Clostridia bacterium]|nr:RNA-binding protein [Clostridia bacterium]MDD4048412.1 RNA-binding protein [Clostridia bacterium]
MTKTLYVGNLPWTTTPEDLTVYFSDYGKVISSRIIKEKETNRSRGFGFVEAEDEDGEKMIAELDGKEFEGRALTVNEAKIRE